jgi:hypothetical protein
MIGAHRFIGQRTTNSKESGVSKLHGGHFKMGSPNFVITRFLPVITNVAFFAPEGRCGKKTVKSSATSLLYRRKSQQ